MNNLVPPSGFDGITRRAEFARLVGEADRQHLPPQSGVRRTTRGTQLLPRIPDLVLDAGGGPGYEGPFRALNLGSGVVGVGPGLVFAGGGNAPNIYTQGGEVGVIGAQWSWPSSANPDQTAFVGPGGDDWGGIDLSAKPDGDWLVYFSIEVDPYSGWFTKDAPYFPDLLSIESANYSLLNGAGAGAAYGHVIATATVVSGLITSIWQQQYGNIYVPTFFVYDGTNDAEWYAGLSHGNWDASPGTGGTLTVNTTSTLAGATERNGG